MLLKTEGLKCHANELVAKLTEKDGQFLTETNANILVT